MLTSEKPGLPAPEAIRRLVEIGLKAKGRSRDAKGLGHNFTSAGAGDAAPRSAVEETGPLGQWRIADAAEKVRLETRHPAAGAHEGHHLADDTLRLRHVDQNESHKGKCLSVLAAALTIGA